MTNYSFGARKDTRGDVKMTNIKRFCTRAVFTRARFRGANTCAKYKDENNLQPKGITWGAAAVEGD